MGNAFLPHCLLLLAVSISVLVTGSTAVSERDALLALYDTLNGENWITATGWDDPGCLATYGIQCIANSVVSIDLQDNNLVGTVPAEVTALHHAHYLDLRGNKVKVPKDIEEKMIILYDRECPAGTFYSFGDCIPCGPGSFMHKERCLVCPPGSFCVGDGSRSLCPFNTAQPFANSTKCNYCYIESHIIGRPHCPQYKCQFSEAEVLSSLYLELSGEYWLNRDGWSENMTFPSLCRAYGVTCGNSSVVGIDLRQNGLAGDITAPLHCLQHLERLDLAENDITGISQITHMNDLSKLEVLYLDGNLLTGLPILKFASSLHTLTASRNMLFLPDIPVLPEFLENLDFSQNCQKRGWVHQMSRLPFKNLNLTCNEARDSVSFVLHDLRYSSGILEYDANTTACPEIECPAMVCPAGEWSNELFVREDSWDTGCEPCNTGHACLPSSTECPMGSYSPYLTLRCFPCSPGTYADMTPTPLCFECPRSTYQDLQGQTDCKDIPPGYYTMNKKKIYPCHEGYHCSFGDELPCPPGTYQDATASASCMLCPVGSTSRLASPKCIFCENLTGSDYCVNSQGTDQIAVCDPSRHITENRRQCQECPKRCSCDGSVVVTCDRSSYMGLVVIGIAVGGVVGLLVSRRDKDYEELKDF